MLVSCIPNSLQFAARDFRLPRGDERRAYPQRSVRSEQRSGSRKELRPCGLRLKCPRASLLVGHRPLAGMLPPRASPWGILGATNCKLFGIHDTRHWLREAFACSLQDAIATTPGKIHKGRSALAGVPSKCQWSRIVRNHPSDRIIGRTRVKRPAPFRSAGHSGEQNPARSQSGLG